MGQEEGVLSGSAKWFRCCYWPVSCNCFNVGSGPAFSVCGGIVAEDCLRFGQGKTTTAMRSEQEQS